MTFRPFGLASLFARDLFIEPELPRQVPALPLLVEAGQPKELAGTYVLLASEAGSYMTGGIYAVTGGTPLLQNLAPSRTWKLRLRG
jgi:NAD(P)-dependent dehydrogenase (short-subunit alcohol dehydrogenase family)